MSERPSPSRYALGSVPNMVRSLLVIVALMAALILAVPRVSSVSQPPVDVAGSARSIADQTRWPIDAAVDLPEGWKATSVRYVRSTDGLMTWHVGYLTPGGRYVAVEQTKDATDGWVRAQTNRAPSEGTVAIVDTVWTKYVRDIKVQNSLVALGKTSDELSTIVTGTGTFEEMQTLIEHLRPVTQSR